MCVEDEPNNEPAQGASRHQQHRRPTSGGKSIRELLGEPGTEDIEFVPPRLGDKIFRPADLE
jgi:hypothetical protein